jgi:hypothetical protein
LGLWAKHFFTISSDFDQTSASSSFLRAAKFWRDFRGNSALGGRDRRNALDNAISVVVFTAPILSFLLLVYQSKHTSM